MMLRDLAGIVVKGFGRQSESKTLSYMQMSSVAYRCQAVYRADS